MRLKETRNEPAWVVGRGLIREAKAAARAEHPAVVTVFEYGSDDSRGLDYLVMERLHGEDLATRIQRVGRLGPKLVLALGVEIADALAHLHERGILHRDLKPANVFLASRGLRTDEIKLLDFGVVKQLDLQTLTAPGQILGTLPYMAPEQLGDPKGVDARCDIFALGVTLYECLTASLPYAEGRVMGIARQIANGTRTPLQT